MRVGLINRIAMLILLATSAAHAQLDSAGVEVPVRIFDLSGQPDDQRRVALDTATAVMATAGVRVAWKACASAGIPGVSCNSPLGGTERVVRLLPTSPSWSRQEGAPMGHSVVDSRLESGVLATIYADRVSWMASRAAINPAVLLGRAMAHELGHLLLGASHSSAGIMRRCWTAKDLRWDSPGDWQFTKEQVSVLGLR